MQKHFERKSQSDCINEYIHWLISVTLLFFYRFWDIFANIPREKKSKDVHERGSLRFIKVITYGLLFLVMFASLVFQKISLMLLVKNQNRELVVNVEEESSKVEERISKFVSSFLKSNI